MHNPTKPEKYHIKIFGICYYDSLTGYAYNLLIYFCQETSVNKELEWGQSEKVFEYLLGSGHHIIADRYYATHSLKLLYRNFYVQQKNSPLRNKKF